MLKQERKQKNSRISLRNSNAIEMEMHAHAACVWCEYVIIGLKRKMKMCQRKIERTNQSLSVITHHQRYFNVVIFILFDMNRIKCPKRHTRAHAALYSNFSGRFQLNWINSWSISKQAVYRIYYPIFKLDLCIKSGLHIRIVLQFVRDRIVWNDKRNRKPVRISLSVCSCDLNACNHRYRIDIQMFQKKIEKTDV